MKSALAALLLFAAITASAQTGQPQPSGTIMGVVTNDEGEPIQGASLCTEVTYEHGSGTSCGGTQTDAHGQFSLRVPLGEIGVFAEKQEAGYWHAVDASPWHRKGIHMATLTRDTPTATVTLTLGPRPGSLKFNVKDNVTDKPIVAYIPRWIGVDDAMMWSLQIPATRMRIPAGIDVIVEVHAEGYHRWFYIDPSTGQPTLRLASGEVKELEVDLEPEEKN